MTRVVVIDPQPAVRAGLAMMLRTEPGLVPVGSAVGASDGMKLVERQRPDVVVLDPHLLDGDGLGTTRRLRMLDPAPRVVLYTATADTTLPVIARVAGADGLVDKAAPAEELFEAIRMVARGVDALPPLDREQLDAVVGTNGGADRDEAGLGAQQHGEAGTDGRLRVDDHDSRHGQHPSRWP